MAMMMTGRVLLVCALCVLWCGASKASAAQSDAGNKDGQPRDVGTGGGPAPSSDEIQSNPPEAVPNHLADKSVTGRNAEPGGEESNQPSAGVSVGRQGKSLEGTASLGPEGAESEVLNPLGEGGALQLSPPPPPALTTTPPPPPALGPPTGSTAPSEPTSLPETAVPGDSVTPGVTTVPQSAQQSQLPSAGTPAASDTTQSTPAGGGAEPTSPSPAGQAAASGQGENSAAEGTPDGTPPSVAAVTHGDNTNTTDTATSEENSTAAGMPAPLSSVPTTNALGSSVGNDACFHDTRVHARLLLVLAALAYG
ncbi:mucin-associated surface protein (MASP), putative, partial [Trypanosoma cruzi marinkellei]